jgi:hypothetical protein
MRFVFAYLDAGSGALLVQLLVGGAAGVVAFFKFRWRNLTAKDKSPTSEEETARVD